MTDAPDRSGIPIDTSAPVLVTGATGYVAGWVVKGLLDAGVTVHAAVRDPGNAAKVQHLVDLAARAPGNIRFFAADLLADGSYSDAMQGCAVVFHTASPFIRDVDDPQRELVDPAVRGTRNVLDSADSVESVRRVVLTSSCAAIYSDAADCAAAPGGVLTEDVWNTTASLAHHPYSYSKVLAEQAAWESARGQDRWRLVVVNPSLVLGPSLNPNPTSDSFDVVRQLGDGTMRWGAPRVGMGVVDVHDVARAHLAAGYLPDAQGRHILAAGGTDLVRLGQVLLAYYGDKFPIPRRALPKRLVWAVAPAAGLTRDYVTRNVNIPWRADTSKSRRELGMVYRPVSQALVAMFGQLVDEGVLTPRA